MKNYKRIERRFLTALVHIIGKIITADKCIKLSELEALHAMEGHFGFNRTLMADAYKLTLAEAATTLKELDTTIRMEMLDDLKSLAAADHFVDRKEALLLLALDRNLQKNAHDQILTTTIELHDADFGGCMLYVESRHDATCHQQLAKLAGQQSGALQLMSVEQFVEHLSAMDAEMIRLLLGYLAPQMTDGQIADFQSRISALDSSSFCERVLVDMLRLEECRTTEPCLLLGIGGGDFLKIPLVVDGERLPMESVLADVTCDYAALASAPATQGASTELADQLLYDGYSKLLLSLLVKSAPRKSHVVVWPNKSEFTFPLVSRRLKLNQQEATLFTLILHYSTTGKCQGLPLAYCAETKRVEQLYRTIYCRKKLVETADVIYPDNLAPIRARLEKKMREQLSGLENIEDYIPFNDDHHYRVKALAEQVLVAPSLNEEPVPFEDFKW